MLSQAKVVLPRVAELHRGIGSAGMAKWGLSLARSYYEASPRYRRWVRKQEARLEKLEFIQPSVGSPTFSVVMPAYNSNEKWLRKAIDSLIAQTYPKWELCVADDASTAAHVRPLLEDYARRDHRIRPVFRSENGHISAASNSALELAAGDFVALMDHDDELPPYALAIAAAELLRRPDTAICYSDEDLINTSCQRCLPFFKPDWSPDLLRSMNYVSHLGVYNRRLVQDVGGFREGFEGSQDYDLVLRCSERVPGDAIHHIPHVLYHWRVIPGSASLSKSEKPYAYAAAERALMEHLSRIGWKASVVGKEPLGAYDIVPDQTETFRAAIVVVGDTCEESFGSMEGIEIERIEPVASQGNFTKVLDDAISRVSSDIVCVIEAGLKPTKADWLHTLASHASRPHIGAVAPVIVDTQDRVIDCGVQLGDDGTPHVISAPHVDFPTPYRRVSTSGNCCALSGRCIVFQREAWRVTNGFNVADFPQDLFAVDWCLRLGEQGRFVAYNPGARLMTKNKAAHKADASDETVKLQSRWRGSDAFRSPNLDPSTCLFRLRKKPRNTLAEAVEGAVKALSSKPTSVST